MKGILCGLHGGIQQQGPHAQKDPKHALFLSQNDKTSQTVPFAWAKP